MKELYIAPEVKVIGFVASEKMAAEVELPYSGLAGVTLTNGTNVASTDIRIPLSLT